MPLTMKQIARRTPKSIFNNATDVRLGKIEMGTRRNGNPVIRAETWTLEDKMGNPRVPKKKYRTWVECLSKDKKTGKHQKISQGFVKVSCSCDYFWAYGCEVVLHKHGAADIRYSNGKDPVVRNPQEHEWCCKHLLVLFDLISQRGL